MKLTVLVIIFIVFQSIAGNTLAQGKISVDYRNVTIEKVLLELENQFEIGFMYNKDLVDVTRKVDIDMQDASIDEILNELFPDEDVTFHRINNQIVISPKFTVAPQQKSVSGNVTDEAGQPLPGVTVIIKGTTNGTVTNMDGNYTISNIPDGAALVFSFVGMLTQEVEVGTQTSINIAMKTDAIGIEEVVAVGYGTQKKINLTGSVSTVQGETLAKRPVTNTASMLQGVLPGVQVTQANGQPQEGGIDIKIRGQGTFSGAGSSPLVLIDGVPGSLSSINPKSIESISVLKDAASASIYGSRAANGVILVTTKSGKKGKLTVEYDFNYGVNTPTKLVDLVTYSPDYMRAWNTDIINKNYGTPITAKMYPESEIAKYENPSDEYPSFDWQDYMINASPTIMHNLSVSGGSDKTRYNLSVGYSDQQGTMEAFRYRRYDAQLNIVSEVSEKLKVGGNILLKKGFTNSERTGQSNYYLTVLAQAPTRLPITTDGLHYSWRAYEFEFNNWNPYLKLKEEFRTDENYTTSAQLWSDYEIVEGLHWNIKGAARYGYNKVMEYIPNNLTERLYRDSSVKGYALSSWMRKTHSDELYTNVYSTLNYDKSIENHNFGALAGYSQEEYNYEYLQGYRKGFASPYTPEINAAATDGQYTKGSSNAWALKSLFGRLTYNYKSKYLFEGNVRYDGTSRLPSESRWGVFPSFSAAWRLSEEAFMESTKGWLSNVKIRGSWGKLGNQNIGLYPYQAMLSFTGAYSFDNTSLTQGVAQTSLNNRNIMWETTTTTDVGLDLTLFNKLSMSIDVYKKYTKDILRSAQTTGVVGLSAPTINDGEMQNVGFDLDLTYRDQIKSGALTGMNFYAQVILSSYKNKLMKYGAVQDGGWYLREEGRPWNTFYLLQVEGIFQSAEEVANSPSQYGANTQPGMLKFKDVSGPDGVPDNKIDNYDRVPMEKGVFPSATYAFNLGADWKGFDIYALFQGVAGQKTFVSGWGFEPFVQGSPPTKKILEEAWTPENHSTTTVMIGDPISYGRNSTYRLKDNSYLRLKALQLGYTLPSRWIEELGIDNVRIYFSGDNLLTFTKYEGLDPEREGSGRFLAYPQNKVVSFGFNIKF
ncbi:TonB-dependent receptor [Prolixibacteraceae bacterium Z1-6]|uniref:TonB-dependent receptor n=1 Tax=Draconibacterium aestuarii TaxID=2998507 RepID=A0A9X3FAM0_9BACT|nr:TonB-dependent receptor [Prolixibacteraceae bacterium Z1-6]